MLYLHMPLLVKDNNNHEEEMIVSSFIDIDHVELEDSRP